MAFCNQSSPRMWVILIHEASLSTAETPRRLGRTARFMNGTMKSGREFSRYSSVTPIEGMGLYASMRQHFVGTRETECDPSHEHLPNVKKRISFSPLTPDDYSCIFMSLFSTNTITPARPEPKRLERCFERAVCRKFEKNPRGGEAPRELF